MKRNGGGDVVLQNCLPGIKVPNINNEEYQSLVIEIPTHHGMDTQDILLNAYNPYDSHTMMHHRYPYHPFHGVYYGRQWFLNRVGFLTLIGMLFFVLHPSTTTTMSTIPTITILNVSSSSSSLPNEVPSTGGTRTNIPGSLNYQPSTQPLSLVPLLNRSDNTDKNNRTYIILHTLERLDLELEGQIILVSNKTKFQMAAYVWTETVLPPLAVIQVANGEDVRRAVPILVGLARDYDFPFRVKSGGMSMAGYSTVANGAILSLSQLTTWKWSDGNRTNHTNHPNHPNDNNPVKDDYRIVTMEPGISVEQWMDELLAKNGTAGVLASAARVAMGGFLMGGGYGYMSRRYGLGIDNVERLRVVLADGSVKDLSRNDGDDDSTNDLFWALRGAGNGNYGVVIEMDYRVYPTQDEKLAALVKVPFPHVGSFLYQLGQKEQRHDLPREFFARINRVERGSSSNMDGNNNNDWAVIELFWMGDDDDSLRYGRHYLQHEIFPLFPSRDNIGRHALLYDFSWSMVSKQGEQPAWESRIYQAQVWNGFLFASNNTQDIWDDIQENMSPLIQVCPDLFPQIELWGGAVADIPSNATAFPHRQAVYNVGLVLLVQNTTEPNSTETPGRRFQQQSARVNGVWPLIARHLTGSYVNYPMSSLTQDDYPRAYWGNNLKRLVEIKRKYDPIDSFFYEQSVPLYPKESFSGSSDESP